MRGKIKNFIFYFLLIFVFLFACLIRIATITNGNGLSYDELYSWLIASNPDILSLLKNLIDTDYHPPLHFAYLHFWMKF